MKNWIVLLAVSFIMSGCTAVQQGADVARITSNTMDLSRQIDELQEKLSPYIHNQKALKDLDDLQGDMKYMMLGDTRVGTVQSIFYRYLVIKSEFVSEYLERKSEAPSELQATLERLYKDLNLNDDDVERSIKNNTVDKVEVARHIYEFGKVGLRLYEVYKEVH